MTPTVRADSKSSLNAGDAPHFIPSCHGQNSTTSGDHHVAYFINILVLFCLTTTLVEEFKSQKHCYANISYKFEIHTNTACIGLVSTA